MAEDSEHLPQHVAYRRVIIHDHHGSSHHIVLSVVPSARFSVAARPAAGHRPKRLTEVTSGDGTASSYGGAGYDVPAPALRRGSSTPSTSRANELRALRR